MGLIDQAKAIQSEIDSTFTAAYKALQKANIEMGIHYVEEIAGSLPVTDDIRIKARSIMGTEIPLVEYTPSKDEKPPYSFYSTSDSLDEARIAFRRGEGASRRPRNRGDIRHPSCRGALEDQKRASGPEKRHDPVLPGTCEGHHQRPGGKGPRRVHKTKKVIKRSTTK